MAGAVDNQVRQVARVLACKAPEGLWWLPALVNPAASQFPIACRWMPWHPGDIPRTCTFTCIPPAASSPDGFVALGLTDAQNRTRG
ncbi:MAG: hypothetical protein M3499_04665 [Actinomycetota bacterium]|nr:hypothetical protein [Actinomycetota bacterium]